MTQLNTPVCGLSTHASVSDVFDANTRACQHAGMDIGARIRERRKALGLSQAQVAERAGTHQQTVGRIETGKVDKSFAVPAILKALGLRPEEFAPDLRDADFLPQRPDEFGAPAPGQLPDLPVYGLAEGGDGQLIIDHGEVIDRFPRPPALAHVPDAYCLNVAGESMYPVFRQGDLVIIHPHLPPKPEDGVVLYAAEGRAAMIKEFVRSQQHHWTLRRYQPKVEEFTVPKKEWPKCHVVYARFSRR